MAVITATDQTILSILHANKLVLVDFWGSYCGPCKLVAPILEQIAKNKQNTMKIVKINVEENPRFASRIGIRAVPTFVIFQNGKPVNKKVGYHSEEELVSFIHLYL